MRKKILITDMAKAINELCEQRSYFYACGLVKETIRLWPVEMAKAFLCDEARQMADHYREA